MPKIIRYYDKSTDEYIGEIDFPEVEIDFLQSVFSESDQNPMYDCYPINKEILSKLKGRLSITQDLNLDKYDYFLEHDA